MTEPAATAAGQPPPPAGPGVALVVPARWSDRPRPLARGLVHRVRLREPGQRPSVVTAVVYLRSRPRSSRRSRRPALRARVGVRRRGAPRHRGRPRCRPRLHRPRLRGDPPVRGAGPDPRLPGARAHRLAFFVAWAASAPRSRSRSRWVRPPGAGPPGVPLAVPVRAVFIAFVILHLVLLTDCAPRRSTPRRPSSTSRRQQRPSSTARRGLLTAIVVASPVPTQAFTPDGSVVLWNPASERVFGWPSDEIVGARLPPAMTPEDVRVESTEQIRRTLAGSVINGERTRRLARDGTEVWVDIYAAPMVDGEGRTIGVAGQLVDVTEQIALEAQLRQSAQDGGDRAAVRRDRPRLQQPADGHPRQRRAAPVGLDAGPDGLRTTSTRSARRPTGRRDLTRQLLAFARRAVLEPRVLDLTAVIREFAPMLGRLIGEHVQLERRPRARHRARPGRPRPARAGRPQPRGQRPRRDARRRHAPHRDRATRCGTPATPRAGTCVLTVADTGVRDGRRDAGPHLRAVLHDQGAGQGHRPGAGDGVRDRQHVRGRDPGGVGARPGDDVHDPAHAGQR